MELEKVQAWEAKPESYYLLRWVAVEQASNGFVLIARLPVRAYDQESGDRVGRRFWGQARLIFTTAADVTEWIGRYLTLPPGELDRLADRVYSHDMADD